MEIVPSGLFRHRDARGVQHGFVVNQTWYVYAQIKSIILAVHLSAAQIHFRNIGQVNGTVVHIGIHPFQDSFLLENKEAIVILLLQCRSISACRKRCKLIPIFLAGNRIQFKCDVRVQLCI